MELETHRLLNLELDRKMVLYQEDVLRLKVKAAELRSRVWQTAGPSLMKDLRHMGSIPERSDVVTFICQGGEQVEASRMLVVAQSEFLRSLLSNGMAETEQSEVTLPEVPLDAFLLVLNYLYTAELWEQDLKFSDEVATETDLVEYELAKIAPFSLDWSFMFRAIGAAEFLLLNELECLLVTRLSVDLPRQILVYTEEVLNQVTKRFTVLCNFLDEVQDSSCRRYLYIIGLHLLKIMSEHDLSLIRWCSTTATDGTDDSSDGGVHPPWLPDPKRAMSLLMNYAEKKQFFVQAQCYTSELRAEFVARIRKDHFEALKGTINLGHIHPELLIHVVEPLQLFSSSEMGEVLRDQLLKASKWRRQLHSIDSQCCWQFLQDGNIRTIHDHRLRSDQITVANAGMWCDLIYQWEICHLITYVGKAPVPSSCPSFTLEVGFLSVVGREIMEDSLSASEWSWAFKLWKEESVETIRCMFFENGKAQATSLEGSARMETDEGEEQFTAVGPPSSGLDSCGHQWAIHLRVKLDRVKNMCSITHCRSGGKDYSVNMECKNLSRGLLFPAVYVLYEGNCETETQLRLGEGFNLSF
ncbi:hypothetical protein R1sor_023792 [Riccia sorocarpa]|uniref:BTB domain-containing protein n=1 Tax=Riccia sorocarpa TaxID=122646 RepID=A0ABD3GQH2_9MARC